MSNVDMDNAVDELNRSDARFLLSFADDLEAGMAFKQLARRWSEVDSAVRDYVPDDAFDFIGRTDGFREADCDDKNDPFYRPEMADTSEHRKLYADKIRKSANRLLRYVENGEQKRLF